MIIALYTVVAVIMAVGSVYLAWQNREFRKFLAGAFSRLAVLIGAPSRSYVRVMKDRLTTVYAKVLFFSTWSFKNEF